MTRFSAIERSVVISGASSGIGLATAEEFATHGWTVVIGARRLEKLLTLKDHLRKLGAKKVLAERLDVLQAGSVDVFSGEALNFCGGTIDVLVNNAGLALGLEPVATGKLSDWQTMIDTNVTGLLRLTQSLLPSMIEQKNGHIINLGSIAGHATYAGGAVYAATKHAVKAISGALRLELNGTPLRISSIDPGMVETEFSEVRFNDRNKAKDVYKGMTPLTPKDIAECVYFAATRPAHVNIDQLIVMPTDQASIYKVHKN